MTIRVWSVALAAWALIVWAPGCRMAPPELATPQPTPTPAPLPTSTQPPPPRPTAAPAALSPPASPDASPVARPLPTPRPAARVRVAVLGELSDSGLLIGQAKGFFAERGLVVQAARFAGPGAALSALSSGQAEAACLPVNAELLGRLAQGSTLKLVAEAGGAPPGRGAAGLVVRPDLVARLKLPTDLRGFRIAVPDRGGALEVELAQLLRQGWLTRTDVEMTVLEPAEIGPALAGGAIDAAMLPEPSLSEIEWAGIGRIWRRSDRIMPNHLTAVLVFNGRFAQVRSDAARGFMTAYLKAARLYNDAFVRGQDAAQAELIPILSQIAALAETDQLDRMVLPGINPNGMVNIETLRLDQQYFLASGYLTREVDLASVVDGQFAAFAITQLGEYRLDQPTTPAVAR